MKTTILRSTIAALATGVFSLAAPTFASTPLAGATLAASELSGPALAAASGAATKLGSDSAVMVQASIDGAGQKRLSPVLGAVEVNPVPIRMVTASPLRPGGIGRTSAADTADEITTPNTGTMILAALALMLWIAGRRLGR